MPKEPFLKDLAKGPVHFNVSWERNKLCSIQPPPLPPPESNWNPPAILQSNMECPPKYHEPCFDSSLRARAKNWAVPRSSAKGSTFSGWNAKKTTFWDRIAQNQDNSQPPGALNDLKQTAGTGSKSAPYGALTWKGLSTFHFSSWLN